MSHPATPRLLFLCMGNICRSPTVEGVARSEFARAGVDVRVASAGTEDYHVGAAADPRAIRVAREHGYAIESHRARQVEPADFGRYDRVFVMDRRNLADVQRFRPQPAGVVPELFLGGSELPDPYYGTDADFIRVIDLAREGVERLLRQLRTGSSVRGAA